MKSLRILGVLAGLLIAACGGSKIQQDLFPYNQAWELAYLGSSRPEPDALFPDRKPYLIFEADSKMAMGNSGCNGYAAPIEVSGASLSFGTPGPSTLMYCGEGEGLFREMLQQADLWELTAEGKLQLLHGEVLLMEFRKIPNPE